MPMSVVCDWVFQCANISHDWSPLPHRATKRVIVVGIALFDEARVVGESGDVVLGEITQHRVHALLQLVQAGAEMEACGLACAFEDRSEEHTSELQSLIRISYAVFCLKKKITNKKTALHNEKKYTQIQ